MMDILCPCGSTQTYSNCCQLFHSGQQIALTAEQLMRSRFSAFFQGAKGLPGMNHYLFETHHQNQHQENELEELQQAFKQQQWLGLKILKSEKGQKNDTHGQVEFVAFYQNHPSQKEPEQLHECSNFVKENDRWLYVNGDIRPDIKLKRNEACWCGSHKKYKQCHGK